MRALLLSAGFGTRLKPITNNTPKCLVEINNKPLLDYWLDSLFEQGIERVLINTHYLSEKVSDHISRSKWREYIDITNEEKLLGTGGTIAKNREYFLEESFLVAHADNLTRFSLKQFQSTHLYRSDNINITMMTFLTTSPHSCGIVKTNDEGIVMELHEKVKYDAGNIANGAIYILDKIALSKIVSINKTPLDLSTEILPLFLGRINTFFNADYLRDIGNAEALEIARSDAIKFDLTEIN